MSCFNGYGHSLAWTKCRPLSSEIYLECIADLTTVMEAGDYGACGQCCPRALMYSESIVVHLASSSELNCFPKGRIPVK